MSASAPSPRLRGAKAIALASVTVALIAVGYGQVEASQAGGFPARGSCHPRGRGLYLLPDPACTPGATDPAVTQATIGRTICVPGWSESVRPPESITKPQKRLVLASYGYYDGHALGRYELDHLKWIGEG